MSAWVQSTFTARMAYGGGGLNHLKLYAFAVGCARHGGACRPLWTRTMAFHSQPAVADGVVSVGGGDNKLYAFALAP